MIKKKIFHLMIVLLIVINISLVVPGCSSEFGDEYCSWMYCFSPAIGITILAVQKYNKSL
jgi:hypothetical protein